MSNSDLPGFRHALEQAALVAGKYLKKAFESEDLGGHSFKTANPIGIVTKHDKHAETLIKDSLRKVFPELAFVGEEHGSTGMPDARYVAYIDPLDGTTNFSQHIPQFVTMIAVYDTQLKRVVSSVIYDPMAGASGKMFSSEWRQQFKQYEIYKNTNSVKLPAKECDDSVTVVHISTLGHCLHKGYLSDSEYDLIQKVNKGLEDQNLRLRVSGSSGFDTISMIESMINGHASACIARAGAAWDFLPALPFAEALGGTFRMPEDNKCEQWQMDASQVARMRIDGEVDKQAYYDWICWGDKSVLETIANMISITRKEHMRQSQVRT